MSVRNKSVLFVGAYPRTAALERYVSGDLALRLESRGWKIQVTSRSNGRLGRLGDMLLAIWRARRNYAMAAVDVFSGPAFIWAEASCALLRYLGKPYVLTLHGGGLPEFSRRNRTRVKKLLASAAAVTCPSPYLMAEMKEFCAGLILLPNGLELERYPFRERKAPLRRLTWLRAFHEIYNPELAVRVLDQVRKICPDDIRLTMIGPDKGDGSLQQTRALAVRLGLEGAVDFHGAVAKQDVPGRLAAGDIFLNTTNYDNTPVSVLEALACGLCVVSTNVGGMPYLVAQEKDGLLVSPNDESAMVKAVGRVLSEPGLAARLSQNARAKAEQFDWSRILPQWEALLFEVAAQHSDV